MKSCHQQCGESDQRLPQCLSPGRTCSTLWAISFCACWRAALAALSCCTSLSLDSLSSVSSSSTLPSNCGNKRFVTCQTCLMTWEPGDTPGLTCCAGWYLRQDYSVTGMTIRRWGWVRHGPVISVEPFAEKERRMYFQENKRDGNLFLYIKVLGNRRWSHWIKSESVVGREEGHTQVYTSHKSPLFTFCLCKT